MMSSGQTYMAALELIVFRIDRQQGITYMLPIPPRSLPGKTSKYAVEMF